MSTTVEILAGNVPTISDEVELLYGVKAAWVDESVFEDCHSVLDEILPGHGPLSERVQAFRERSRISTEAATSILPGIIADIRSRTRRSFALPIDEECEVAFVADKPWRAYNWYLGNGKSLIEINSDASLEMWDIPIMVAHETYPGHHTERTVKEFKLYVEQNASNTRLPSTTRLPR